MAAYYNEIDPFAAQWLRNLIAAGHIAPGDVDERSIVDVRADDLRGYEQCHFFAGIGVWSYSLRLAGWPDSRSVWTGSCPCQPFSAAGKGQADEDDRHLAPSWLRLIGECRPAIVFGEQVGAAIRVGWLDALFTEMEAMHYACGAVDFPACSVGAPHIRQRLYFVADAKRRAAERYRHELAGTTSEDQSGEEERQRLRNDGRDGGATGGIVGDADGTGTTRHGKHSWTTARSQDISINVGSGWTNHFWSACDWLPCIDGKARPVEPGTFPLAHGAPARVGLLRAYGNAIVAPQATEFIKAYMECRL